MSRPTGSRKRILVWFGLLGVMWAYTFLAYSPLRFSVLPRFLEARLLGVFHTQPPFRG